MPWHPGLPCFGVTTLEAIAEAIDWPTLAHRPALVVLDNKQDGVYAQLYQAGRALEPPSVQNQGLAERHAGAPIAVAGDVPPPLIAACAPSVEHRKDGCSALPDRRLSGGDRRPSLACRRKAVGAAGTAVSPAAHDRAAPGESGGRMIGSVLIEPAIIGDASAIAALDRTVLDGRLGGGAVASLIAGPDGDLPRRTVRI